MTNQEKIVNKFQKLLTEGQEILRKCGYNEGRWSHHPSPSDYLRFRTESLNLIDKVCGKESGHYQELQNIIKSKEMTNKPYYFDMCYGILEAAHNDFADDFLFDLKTLISAELLGDLLEQAETLLKRGYHIPAASLAGAVLEDSLRKLSEKSKIDVPEKTKIDKLNIALAKKGVYNKLIQKEITAKADIRNNADHGHYKEFNADDVKDMIKWIIRFESEYLN